MTETAAKTAHTIGDRAADLLVRTLEAELEATEANIRALPGPDMAERRKALRAYRADLQAAVAGLNTGEGVTRRSAVRS